MEVDVDERGQLIRKPYVLNGGCCHIAPVTIQHSQGWKGRERSQDQREGKLVQGSHR